MCCAIILHLFFGDILVTVPVVVCLSSFTLRNLQPSPACSYKDLKLDRALKTKWQEKSELIGKLEKEVVEMRNNFKEREKTSTDERDKAIQAAK